jgi:predicted O-methyltransferase YrrM
MNLRFVLTTPSYIVARLRLRRFMRTHPDLPWLTRDAIDHLSTMLHADDRGLEWGSGRSTLWFAKRVQHLISVEHNREWFERVRTMVAGISNVDLRLCEVPKDQVRTMDESENPDYVRVTEDLEPESLGFVLVDGGLARDQCAHRAIPLLKSGGILIVDNANWYLPSDSKAPSSRRPGDSRRFDAASWDSFLTKVAPWRHIWTTDGVTCTAMWLKP